MAFAVTVLTDLGAGFAANIILHTAQPQAADPALNSTFLCFIYPGARAPNNFGVPQCHLFEQASIVRFVYRQPASYFIILTQPVSRDVE